MEQHAARATALSERVSSPDLRQKAIGSQAVPGGATKVSAEIITKGKLVRAELTAKLPDSSVQRNTISETPAGVVFRTRSTGKQESIASKNGHESYSLVEAGTSGDYYGARITHRRLSVEGEALTVLRELATPAMVKQIVADRVPVYLMRIAKRQRDGVQVFRRVEHRLWVKPTLVNISEAQLARLKEANP